MINKFLEDFFDVPENSGIEEDAMSVLMEYDYPGNIRELRSILQSAVNLAQSKPISKNFLPRYIRGRNPTVKKGIQKEDDTIVPLTKVEKDHILKVYQRTGRNKVQTAKLLAIGLNTLRRKLASYGVE